MTGRVHGNGDERSELIASEIRAWLARRKLTQGDLARHLGIARSAVSVRMSGARDFTLVELMEIAEWLDVTLADLLGPEILRTRRSPRTELVGAGASEASEKLLRLDSNQQPFGYVSPTLLERTVASMVVLSTALTRPRPQAQ